MTHRTSALRHVTLFVVSFVLVSWLIRDGLPTPSGAGLRAKLEAFDEIRDEVDCLFLGSSHVQSGVIPAEFEAHTARAGLTVEAFNLGVAGLGGHELDEYLERILDERTPRLRWIFVELLGWAPDPREYQRARRNVAWHDPSGTLHALEGALHRSPGTERLRAAAGHLRLFAMWLGNAGAWNELALEWLEPGAQPARLSAAYRREGGYLALEEFRLEVRAARRAWLASPTLAEQQLGEPFTPRPGPVSTALSSELDRRALAARERRAREAGVELVHVVFPIEQPTPELWSLAAEAQLAESPARIWIFNDPLRFAPLYEWSSRYDAHHLSRRGAELLTEQLTRRFVQQEHPGAAEREQARLVSEDTRTERRHR